MYLEQGSSLELPFKFKATRAKDYGGSFFRLWWHTIAPILSYAAWGGGRFCAGAGGAGAADSFCDTGGGGGDRLCAAGAGSGAAGFNAAATAGCRYCNLQI